MCIGDSLIGCPLLAAGVDIPDPDAVFGTEDRMTAGGKKAGGHMTDAGIAHTGRAFDGHGFADALAAAGNGYRAARCV